MSKTIKMTKDGKTADVHPDMVDEYKAGGYVAEKKDTKSAKPKA